MGRRRKKVEVTEENWDWPFEISIEIKRDRPKICFMSGCPREYYPDDPGISKFGNTYCIPDSEDMADFNYLPSDNRLNKPVSIRGYGMGGLLAPRFAAEDNSDTPAPNEYQEDLIPAPVKKSEKVQKTKWKDFVDKYLKIVEDQFVAQAALDNAQANQPTRQSAFPKPLDLQRSLNLPYKPCPLKTSAFGMTLQSQRFQRNADFDVAGAGTYDPVSSSKRESFQVTNPQGKLIPRVRVVCLPGTCDLCMSCGIDLIAADYYQTRDKFKVVNAADMITYGKAKLTYLSLCRSCYCVATKKGLEPWTKGKIPMIFMKARHCNSVHDHQEGHAEFLTKATCKGMLHLARKELVFSKYFKDNPCHKAI